MITVTITWHLLLLLFIQLIFIIRFVHIANNDKGGYGAGMGTGIAFLFYGIVSVAMWLTYGGIVWW